MPGIIREDALLSKQKSSKKATEWSFSLRGGCPSSDEDSSSSDDGNDADADKERGSSSKKGKQKEETILSADTKLMRELDIATRAENDTATFKSNPWSIARVNAASRPMNSSSKKMSEPAPTINASCPSKNDNSAARKSSSITSLHGKAAAMRPPAKKPGPPNVLNMLAKGKEKLKNDVHFKSATSSKQNGQTGDGKRELSTVSRASMSAAQPGFPNHSDYRHEPPVALHATLPHTHPTGITRESPCRSAEETVLSCLPAKPDPHYHTESNTISNDLIPHAEDVTDDNIDARLDLDEMMRTQRKTEIHEDNMNERSLYATPDGGFELGEPIWLPPNNGNHASTSSQKSHLAPRRFTPLGGSFSSPLRNEITTQPSQLCSVGAHMSFSKESSPGLAHQKPRLIQSSPLRVPVYQTCLPISWKPLVQTAEAPVSAAAAPTWRYPVRPPALPTQQRFSEPVPLEGDALPPWLSQSLSACDDGPRMSQNAMVKPPSYDEIADVLRMVEEGDDDLEDSYVSEDAVAHPATSKLDIKSSAFSDPKSRRPASPCAVSQARARPPPPRYPFPANSNTGSSSSKRAPRAPTEPSYASPGTGVYARLSEDEDANWSTLPSRKRVRTSTEAGANSKGTKQSGMFKLPISLVPPSKSASNATLSGTGDDTAVQNATKRRVITYLPPPPTDTSTRLQSGQLATSKKGTDVKPISKWSIKRAGYDYDGNAVGTEGKKSDVSYGDSDSTLRGSDSSSSATSTVIGAPSNTGVYDDEGCEGSDVTLPFDTSHIPQTYAAMREVMRKRKALANGTWDVLGLPSCGVVYVDRDPKRTVDEEMDAVRKGGVKPEIGIVMWEGLQAMKDWRAESNSETDVDADTDGQT